MQHIAEHDRQSSVAAVSDVPARTTTSLVVGGGGEVSRGTSGLPPTLRMHENARPAVSQVRQKDDTSYIICTEVQVIGAKPSVAGAGSRLSLLMPTPVAGSTEGMFPWVVVVGCTSALP